MGILQMVHSSTLRLAQALQASSLNTLRAHVVSYPKKHFVPQPQGTAAYPIAKFCIPKPNPHGTVYANMWEGEAKTILPWRFMLLSIGKTGANAHLRGPVPQGTVHFSSLRTHVGKPSQNYRSLAFHVTQHIENTRMRASPRSSSAGHSAFQLVDRHM